jgi:Mrp family chromosome partitioning ATPase
MDPAGGWIDANEAADGNRFEATPTPDRISDEVGPGRRAQGPHEITELFNGWKRPMPDSKGTVTSPIASGDTAASQGALALVRSVVCVGSGKGGVGKSTLTANLAAALLSEGRRVGVLDADVWGYSIPRMLGLGAERPSVSAERKIIPLDASGIGVMSIGFFVEEDAAVVWRGPMLHKALKQFLEDVAWGGARLPADRPAARHRRRLDDARATVAAGDVRDRHDTAAGRAAGRAPRGRDGP